MIFVGEIFSLYIIVIAAIETAIALCIVISYYRVTNNYINIKHEFTEAFLSGFLLLSIGGKHYDIFTLYNLILTILFIVTWYYATVGYLWMLFQVVFGIIIIWKTFLYAIEMQLLDFIRLAWPEYLYLFRTPAPNKKRDELFTRLNELDVS